MEKRIFSYPGTYKETTVNNIYFYVSLKEFTGKDIKTSLRDAATFIGK